jgi:hypothetical protein
MKGELENIEKLLEKKETRSAALPVSAMPRVRTRQFSSVLQYTLSYPTMHATFLDTINNTE